MNTKEILVNARQLLLDKGVAKQAFEDEKGCHCMVGAIVKIINPQVKMGSATDNYEDSYANKLTEAENNIVSKKALDLLTFAVFEDSSKNCTDLFDYNDDHAGDPEMVQRKIITAFDVAIEMADAEV